MTDRDDATRLVAGLVSRRCGVVTELVPQWRGPDEPSPPHLWNATLAHFNYQTTPLAMRLTGGKGLTEDAAKLAALGEALERYAGLQWPAQRIRVGPASETAIMPPECVLYSDNQYARGRPYQAWSRDVSTSWITGTELPSGATIDVPASLVFLHSQTPRPEDCFTVASSNGLATGKNLTHAILGGLQELIERDAFMITWLNALPAKVINTPQKGCQAAQIIRHYGRFGVKIQLLLLHTDQAPYVVMAVAQDPDETNAYHLIGLGCDLDPVAAVDKAVFELCQLRAGMVSRLHGSDHKTRLTSPEAVKGLDDHPLFHAIPAHADAFDFLTQTGAATDLGDLPCPNSASVQEALDTTVDAAVKTGARVAYVDITPADIAPLGPRVVRVFATGLQPIHFGFDQGRFGHKRLFDAPVAWGLRDAPLDETGLNPCPHPLA